MKKKKRWQPRPFWSFEKWRESKRERAREEEKEQGQKRTSKVTLSAAQHPKDKPPKLARQYGQGEKNGRNEVKPKSAGSYSYNMAHARTPRKNMSHSG